VGVKLRAPTTQSWYQYQNRFVLLTLLKHGFANTVRVYIPVDAHSSPVFRYDDFAVEIPLAEHFLDCFYNQVNNTLASRRYREDPRPVHHVFNIAFLYELAVESVKFVVVECNVGLLVNCSELAEDQYACDDFAPEIGFGEVKNMIEISFYH